MRVLKLIKGVTCRDRLRNEDIRKELDVKSILQHVEETQLRWFGHVKRMSDDRTAHQWLQWKPSTTARLGEHRNAGWTTSKRRWRDEERHCRRWRVQGCSWTGGVWETSSLTGSRPISTAVQHRYDAVIHTNIVYEDKTQLSRSKHTTLKVWFKVISKRCKNTCRSWTKLQWFWVRSKTDWKPA